MIDVMIRVYDTPKYLNTSSVAAEFEYRVQSYEVITDKDFELEGYVNDPFDEYLVLTFSDGDTATFRNSYVDMFLVAYCNG